MTAFEATLEARQQLSRGLEPQLAALRRLRAPRRVAEILFFVALWGLGIALGIAGVPLVGIIAAGLALNAFFLLTHEGHHNLLFTNRTFAHAVNIALSTPLLTAPTAYRVLHELHHRYLGGPGDPDEYRNYTGNPTKRWAMQWMRLTIGTLVYTPMIPVVAFRRAERADRIRMAAEYAVMGTIWIAAFALIPLDVLLQVWLIPGVIVGYISGVRALAQHALTEAHDPLLASRSVRSNRIVAFLLLNENFHLEHHLFPEIPSYNLPRLRELLRDRIPRAVEAVSYTRFLAAFVARTIRGDESPLGVRA